MKNFKLTAAIAVSMVLFFVSCDRNSERAKAPDTSIAELSRKIENNAEADNAVADTTATVTPQEEQKTEKPSPPKKIDVPEPKIDWDKKIIKTATLRLELKDYKAYNDKVRTVVKQFGGYIANEEQTQNDYQIENAVTIKVPVDQFENAMNTLPVNDSKVMERKITSEDVTTEYVDVKSRLASQKQVLAKYLEFLKQAKNMEETLQVQNEINDIQENIESAAGRAEYLSHAAAFSTINLTYYQLTNGAISPDNTSSFFYKFKDALKTGLNGIDDFVLMIAVLWPLLLLAITGFFLYRKLRKKTIRTA
ncbi:MAG: DUF4349 domain-containing protein [Sphingobacteriales bacterium]|nr:DUF4349 domain-containing protein [Sphingobacteriales bacterium]MBI3719556.1 DUF4349 domain-containing protein [Sphingobacteriales bacterium]